MERVTFAGGVGFSRIVYGLWRLKDGADKTPQGALSRIGSCIDQGITSFDQADIYGDYGCEELFGAALGLQPSLRSRIEIITKCDIRLPSAKFPDLRVKHYDTSPEHITASLENSLRLMGTDWIDMLLLHRPDPLMDPEATGRVLDDFVASGKVRSVGVSNFRPWDWQLLQQHMQTPLSTNQIELNLLTRDPFVNGDIAFLQREGIRPMAWSPLGGGGLFDSSNRAYGRLMPRLLEMAEEHGVNNASVATAWLLAHPAGILPVLGANSPERIARFHECVQISIDRETWFELWELANGHEVP